MTDGLGNTVDFKNTIIIMTSNIGAKHLMKREGLGFQSSKDEIVLEKMQEMVMGEVKRTFNSEFLNRPDEVIVLTSLSDSELMQIMDLLLQGLNKNLVHKAITLSVRDDVDWDQNKIEQGAQISADSEHPAHRSAPCDCQLLPEGGFLAKEKDAVSPLRIMSHKPTEPRHSCGHEEHDCMCGNNQHWKILNQLISLAFGNFVAIVPNLSTVA